MKETLIQFPFINLVIVGQLLFLGAFLSILFVTLSKKRDKFFNKMSNLPLSEE